jgi:Tripartite tricarboxylate transporter TctB family
MRAHVKNPKDVAAGLVFLATAALFAYGLRELPIGTAFRMGPGYFPMVLCILLASFGIVIVFSGLTVEGERLGTVPTREPWRGMMLIVWPIIFFGTTLRGLGMVPALAITVFATTLASQYFRVVTALALTAALTIASWLIFIKGLGLPISLYGPWVGGY